MPFFNYILQGEDEIMEYFSIGKVAKLKNVSIKSLRYYDSIGILKPAYINTNTNYRYYTEEQLYLLDVIHLCITLGIPLKNIQNYVKNNSINLQKLLYDSKIIADQRIHDIYSDLEALQNTLSSLSLSDTYAAPLSPCTTGTLCPTHKQIDNKTLHYPKRTLLTFPLNDSTKEGIYGQAILKLFILAQQYELTANYPSGILYEYKNGTLNKFMFLHLNETSKISPEIKAAIREFPECDCPHVYLKEHLKKEASTYFSDSSFITNNCIILETDILDSSLKKEGNLYDLIFYK